MIYDLWEDRNQLVSKSNTLVRKARYSLTAQQQKIILYMVSRIKPGAEDFDTYEFDLKDMCMLFGITNNGKNYANFKRNIEALVKKTFWIETERSDYLIQWVNEVELRKGDATVRLRFDSRLKPYLLDLRDNFTAYPVENILCMESGYSIRLYEILKSYAYIGEYEDTIEHLKELLASADYDRFNNFKVKVLEVACNEINLYTDIEVSYKPIRTSRTITGIKFSIRKKENEARVQAFLERGAVLNGEQKEVIDGEW